MAVYVDSYPGEKRTRRNQHSALVTLFEYAKRHGNLPKGLPTEMDCVEKPEAGKPRKLTFSPMELEALIKAGLAIYSRGPAARPMKPSWVSAIQLQYQTANVPFFFKQWGGVAKKTAGRILHGKTYDAFPL